MSQTLTSSAGVIEPDDLNSTGYGWGSESGTVEHRLVRGGTAYSLFGGGPWRNSLELFFYDRAAAFEAGDLLKTNRVVWSWADSEVPESDMDVVVGRGQVSVAPSSGEVGGWVVTVPISQVEESGS